MEGGRNVQEGGDVCILTADSAESNAFKVIILQLKKKKEVPGSKPGAVEDVAVQVSITGLEDQMSDAGLSPTGCEEPWMF